MKKPEVALVTGGGRGIGRAIAERLAADGFDTVIGDLDLQAAGEVAAGLVARGLAANAVRMDVRDRESVRRALASHPRIDVCVNNAGVADFIDFENLTEADFERMLAVNVTGLFVVTQECAARMPAGGRVINISSRASLGAKGLAHYAASKAAVNGLTRSMALELGPRDISVNSIGPGLIDTPLIGEIPADRREAMLRLQPTGKMGRPADIAQAVSFLADSRTQFITGQFLLVDGGKSLGGALGG